MKKIIIGSRASKLALVYANKVKNLILEKEVNLSKDDIIIETIKTSGDIFSDRKREFNYGNAEVNFTHPYFK